MVEGYLMTEPIQTSSTGLPIGPPVNPVDGMAAPARQPLAGQIVTLRPLEAERDAEALFQISHSPDADPPIWTYMPYGPFTDGAHMEIWLQHQALSKDPLFFTVFENSSNKQVGLVSFLAIVPEMRRLELGHIWYTPAAQRTKVNTETIYLMLTEAFDRLNYRRVEWKCDALNARSRAAALRLGFSYEGLFRQHLIYKGRNRDTAWFAMLDYEWPAIKKNMERWLYGNEPDLSLRQLNNQLKSDTV
jgi:RimJ/RimL family protein N-acetyltransferase